MKEQIVFNETFAVDVNLSNQWREWMNENYIPVAMESGLFESFIFSSVANGVNQGAQSFALQFVAINNEKVDSYISEVDPSLKQQLNRNFAGGYASFVTILNIISKK